MIAVLESPYKGTADYTGTDHEQIVRENKAYAAVVSLVLAGMGYHVYASHLHCTSFLDDTNPAERAVGIGIGLGIAAGIDIKIFALDNGWSSGMAKAFDVHSTDGRSRVYGVRLGTLKRNTWQETLEHVRGMLSLYGPPALYQLSAVVAFTRIKQRPEIN